jgi:hypothetical protein
VSCSQRSMEASVTITHHPARWSESLLAWLLLAYSPPRCHRASKEIYGMPVSRQTDPYTSADIANDPALMDIHGMGAGYPRTIPQGHRRVPVPVHHHRQVHKVAGSNPCCQDQQAICSQVYQVNCLHVRGPKHDHH